RKNPPTATARVAMVRFDGTNPIGRADGRGQVEETNPIRLAPHRRRPRPLRMSGTKPILAVRDRSRSALDGTNPSGRAAVQARTGGTNPISVDCIPLRGKNGRNEPNFGRAGRLGPRMMEPAHWAGLGAQLVERSQFRRVADTYRRFFFLLRAFFSMWPLRLV